MFIRDWCRFVWEGTERARVRMFQEVCVMHVIKKSEVSLTCWKVNGKRVC